MWVKSKSLGFKMVIKGGKEWLEQVQHLMKGRTWCSCHIIAVRKNDGVECEMNVLDLEPYFDKMEWYLMSYDEQIAVCGKVK